MPPHNINGTAFELYHLKKNNKRLFMKLTILKFHLHLLHFEYKCAAIIGLDDAKQNLIEKLTMLQTHLRVEEEQLANRFLFND